MRFALVMMVALALAPAARAADSYERVTTNADGTVEWLIWGVEASSASCKKVHVTYVKTNGGPGPFSNTLWTYGERWGWCWNGRKVTSLYGYTRYFTCCDPGWDFVKHVSLTTTGWAGDWAVSRKAKGKFKFCVPIWGCVDYDYPWVKLTLTGDGGWSRAKGNG
jgi:hypothetical protein